jgi:ATP-dependent RNA helicase DDX55/SPB4
MESVVLSGLISLPFDTSSGVAATQSPNILFLSNFTIRFASLDLGHLATSFCLLRLPKMPELRDYKGKLKNFAGAGPDVCIFTIAYLDKSREAARQKRLAEELAAGGKNAKQIKAELKKAEGVERQKERRQAAIAKGRKPEKKRGRHAQIVDEWDELAKEERLYKKLRRRKITKDQYEELMHGGSSKNKKPAVIKNDGDSSDDDGDSASS